MVGIDASGRNYCWCWYSTTRSRWRLYHVKHKLNCTFGKDQYCLRNEGGMGKEIWATGTRHQPQGHHPKLVKWASVVLPRSSQPRRICARKGADEDRRRWKWDWGENKGKKTSKDRREDKRWAGKGRKESGPSELAFTERNTVTKKLPFHVDILCERGTSPDEPAQCEL